MAAGEGNGVGAGLHRGRPAETLAEPRHAALDSGASSSPEAMSPMSPPEPPMRLRSLLLLAAALFLAPAALAAPPASDDAIYRTPPPAIADLLTAPRLPRGAPNASPDGAWLAVSDLRSLIPISVLAEPVLKLAGL